MTMLARRKSKMVLETADTIRGRAVILEANSDSPAVITVRLKGTRTRYQISAAGIYWQAVKIAVERARAERKKGNR